jgi:hypothetical protein
MNQKGKAGGLFLLTFPRQCNITWRKAGKELGMTSRTSRMKVCTSISSNMVDLAYNEQAYIFPEQLQDEESGRSRVEKNTGRIGMLGYVLSKQFKVERQANSLSLSLSLSVR